MSSAVAALIAFSVQASYGAPARSTQTVRALWCCSKRCDHMKTPAAAGHCCGVAGAESELGVCPQKLCIPPVNQGPVRHNLEANWVEGVSSDLANGCCTLTTRARPVIRNVIWWSGLLCDAELPGL